MPAATAGSQMSPAALQAMLGGQNQQRSAAEQERSERDAEQKSKHFQCLYPVYFDSTRSREGGRRVKKADAVPNPLASQLVDALQHIGRTQGVPFQVVMEPVKTHPKDWANPGRVKVLVKKDGKAVNPQIHNSKFTCYSLDAGGRGGGFALSHDHAKLKIQSEHPLECPTNQPAEHHLYTLISSYLKQHPTTEASPLRFRIQGMPMPKDNKILPPAIPRGFKIGSILPLHSPALSGGGVSDNLMKDMMDQMGGQMPPGMEGLAGLMGGGGGGGGGAGMGSPAAGQTQKKVKEKKKK